jgi:hypothetical protein
MQPRLWAKKAVWPFSYADAPEIDGIVSLLPPEKISKTFKVGEFTGPASWHTQGHDLVAQPFESISSNAIDSELHKQKSRCGCSGFLIKNIRFLT